MADHDDTQKPGSEQPETRTPTAKGGELPSVESPPLSPAEAAAPVIEPPTLDSPIAPAAAMTPRRLVLRRRRLALLAASVTIAAALGAVIGAVTANSLATSHEKTAGLDDRKETQQTIARLGSELSTLKASLEAASKSARAQTAQIAKLSDALKDKLATAKAHDALVQAGAEVTGSISAPATAPAAAPDTPLPQPRPRQIAAAEGAPRPLVVPDWHVRGAARGFVLVESRGEIFEVVPGADLPGLGRVESIRRVGGRWIVETPKGLIVSSVRGPRYFD
jgi:hypothetical protein